MVQRVDDGLSPEFRHHPLTFIIIFYLLLQLPPQLQTLGKDVIIFVVVVGAGVASFILQQLFCVYF
jgi:hypothetical protein